MSRDPRRLRSAWGRWVVGVPLILVLATPPAAVADPRPRGGHKPTAGAKRPAPRAPQRLGHTVEPGDSLWTISRRYGVSLDALARANRLAPGQLLRPGQHLIIPSAPAGRDSQEPSSPAAITLGRPPAAEEPGFIWPVSAPVGSRFGPRGRRWHGGIDIRAERGTPIRAAAPGMVVQSGWEREYGRVIKIWHHHDFMTVSAHNQENYVRVGDWVERGQVIATAGSTGRVTGVHLHFEIRLNGRKYDPLFWLPPPDGIEVASSGPSPAGSSR